MAKTGNHGQIIPRDRELLHRLYIVEGRTLTEMARMFGVTNHKSVSQVLWKMGLALPGQGNRRPKRLCIDCKQKPPKRLRHKLTKNGTGTRCTECLRAYKARWMRDAVKSRPEVKEKRLALLKRWYEQGPINPQGEEQWIRRAKHLLRTNRRLLQTSNPGVSRLRKKASAAAATSQT